ncbi:MAG: amidohydrolase [Kineosporiaceae bacterium]
MPLGSAPELVDTVFVGGELFTAGLSRSRRAALALRGGRIAALGDDREILALRGPATDTVDLRGRLLLPGFQDAHVHPVVAGANTLRCDLHGCTSADEVLARVASYTAAHPDLAWLVGSGWSMAHFPGGTPTRQLLDGVVGDRPVYLTNRDGHGAWVNTRALGLAGVTSATADPVDGRVEREPGGFPAGTLQEGAAELVARLVPPAGLQEQLAGLRAAQDLLFSLGVTSWQDAAVGPVFGQRDILEVYSAAAATGDLQAGVVGALWWDRGRGAEQIPELVQRRGDGAGGRFRPTSVKIMLDGVAENFTAAMLEPYLDGCGSPTENAGLDFVDAAGLPEYVAALDAHGFQVHFHALGDRAVRHALDAVEAARAANGPDGGRHHLAHLQVVHPDDIPRFARIGATATIQPLWAAHEPQMDELTIPFMGERRAAWQYPFGDLVRSGAQLAAGSDWFVSSPDPLAGIHVAVNRRGPDAPDHVEAFLPGQALDLATAYTAGSARVNGQESDSGHLRPGMAADLVVLDRNPFDAASDVIADTRVLRTYVDGRLVFAAAAS